MDLGAYVQIDELEGVLLSNGIIGTLLEAQEQATLADTLERIKAANRPIQGRSEAFDFDKHEPAANAVADEISKNLEEQVGVTEDEAPKAEPMHPKSDTTTKFANLQFGRNYDPHNK